MRPWLKGLTAVACLAVGLLLQPSRAWSSPDGPTEYQVKAAFLFNFAKFVEWPTETFRDTEDPFVIGILGDDPFGADLEKTLDGKTIHDRKLVFKHLSDLDEVAQCQVIFISASEEEQVKTILRELRSRPVLTVSDMRAFTQNGGMAGFFVENSRVRFDINLASADTSGLKISSELLKLAKTVEGGPGGMRAP